MSQHSWIRSSLFALVAILALNVFPIDSAVASHISPPFELTFPQEVSETTFTNTWGERRPGGRRHRGTDLLAPRLTEVYAVADGVVDRVYESRTGGRSLRIAHGDGWTSHYVHLNNDSPGTDDGEAPWSMTLAPGVEEGREVKRGQVVGWVGDSGNAEHTIPHTHFELRLNGTSINPYYVLVEAYQRDLAAQIRFEQLLADAESDHPRE